MTQLVLLPTMTLCSRSIAYILFSFLVLRQMIGELSALHSFVYGGEYPLPHHGDKDLESINDVASLGAILQRSAEKRGYLVVDIPQRDPDFHMVDGIPMYSPLSDQALKLSGQVGMKPGDIIVAVNGENVMDVPNIHMLLRNMAGESVRLDVLRMESTSKFRDLHKMKRRLLQNNDGPVEDEKGISSEPLIVVPMTSEENGDLAYAAWEWKSRERAKVLAAQADFSCGYLHVRSMAGAPAMDSFVRGFFPDYDKQALIVDVRNNRGGNIDSVRFKLAFLWICITLVFSLLTAVISHLTSNCSHLFAQWLLDTLQKRAWCVLYSLVHYYLPLD